MGCPVVTKCGGCGLGRQTYQDGLLLKHQKVTNALAHHGLDNVNVLPVVSAPNGWSYRNRAKWRVEVRGDQVNLGLFAPHSGEVFPLHECAVQGVVSLKAMQQVGAWLSSQVSMASRIRAVDVREAAGGKVHITLVLHNQNDVEQMQPEAWQAAIPNLVGLSINIQPYESSFTFGPKTRTVWGAKTFNAEVPASNELERSPDTKQALPGEGGESSSETIVNPQTEQADAGQEAHSKRRLLTGFEVPATGFFQVSTALLTNIHLRMLEHLGARGDLLDLYCGVGLHGIRVQQLALNQSNTLNKPGNLPKQAASATSQLYGIDSVKPAISCARRNADRANLIAEFHAGPVEKLIEPALKRTSGKCVRILMNPGRSGAKPEVFHAMTSKTGSVIRCVYLSCAPDTLARDCKILTGLGWQIVFIQPYDLMPWTDHVEVLVGFEKA